LKNKRQLDKAIGEKMKVRVAMTFDGLKRCSSSHSQAKENADEMKKEQAAVKVRRFLVIAVCSQRDCYRF